MPYFRRDTRGWPALAPQDLIRLTGASTAARARRLSDPGPPVFAATKGYITKLSPRSRYPGPMSVTARSPEVSLGTVMSSQSATPFVFGDLCAAVDRGDRPGVIAGRAWR
jgi:hypothetical protein